jgi:hypothetical protein
MGSWCTGRPIWKSWTSLAEKEIARLPTFLRNKCSDDLMPGSQWVWDSIGLLAKRMSCILILCGQEAGGLENTGIFDSYLSSNPEVFPFVDNDPDGNSVWHGC